MSCDHNTIPVTGWRRKKWICVRCGAKFPFDPSRDWQKDLDLVRVESIQWEREIEEEAVRSRAGEYVIQEIP